MCIRDREIAQVLQRALRLEGYDVKLAGDGIQALDEVHAFLPDLIVLDLGLPRMDGLDVARQLRTDEDDTPILMLTARDALDSRVAGLDVGADDYLVKPFERQELLARMRALRLEHLRDLLVVLDDEHADGSVGSLHACGAYADLLMRG